MPRSRLLRDSETSLKGVIVIAVGLLGLLNLLTAPISATIMHLKIHHLRDTCVYADLLAKGEKFVFFYTSMSEDVPIRVSVINPNGVSIYSDDKGHTADLVFAATRQGMYEFCFRGQATKMLTEEFVSTEIITENDTRLAMTSIMHSESVEGRSLRKITSSLTKVAHILVNAEHLQRNIRSTEHRDVYFIKASSVKITLFSMLQTLLLCALSLFQVACVHALFTRNSRQPIV